MLEIKKKGAHRYSFKLKTESGHTLLKSVEFPKKEDIEVTVRTMKQATKNSLRFERRTNYEGFFRFDIKNSQGQLIGHSLNYRSEAGMENGMKNLMKNMKSLLKLGKL